jgi:hypothetical protein
MSSSLCAATECFGSLVVADCDETTQTQITAYRVMLQCQSRAVRWVGSAAPQPHNQVQVGLRFPNADNFFYTSTSNLQLAPTAKANAHTNDSPWRRSPTQTSTLSA